jgi:Asp-tRNA(Asn)/Glu-tRNA(Gln) amidotransferase B subunit
VQADIELSKLLANYLTSDLLSRALESDTLSDWNAQGFGTLMAMVRDGEISSRVAKDLLSEVVLQGMNPQHLATERGLIQSSSSDVLLPLVEQIIVDNATVVAEFKAGKEAALQFLVGQGMKLSKGSANPKVLFELFKKIIH